ncbi:60S ribosome biogenesis Rrp14 protein [Rutstroemia sp. NJR-2017a WRK4]|nr:60S ribosome biogenesis Rrp14 protein [Rutstroemia sp. NJR-2017a WRK4]
MAESTLQDRLREHAEAFDGLLSLIPAKYYYGEDTSDQWKKKKQTKEQAAAARRAKLDPDSAKTAKDVMDERARKRKLEESEDAEAGSDLEGIEKELPKQGLKQKTEKPAKKQKTLEDDDTTKGKDTPKKNATPKKNVAPEDEAVKAAKALKKEEQKKAKKEKKAAKQQVKKDNAVDQPIDLATEDVDADEALPDASEVNEEDATSAKPQAKKSKGKKTPTNDEPTEEDEQPEEDEIVNFEAEGLEEESSAKVSPAPSSTFSTPNDNNNSTNTSTSSSVPPTVPPKHITLPANPEILRSRLAAKIEALRAARKASNSDGTPARNRQELMEQRRKKEEQRRAHKKELRLKAKAEEDARREAALVSARSSPASMLSPLIRSPENNFAFGRVAFADGQSLTEDLSGLKAIPKKKGPQDVNSALAAAAKKQSRLESMDAEKRADIEEKELWLNAKKKVNGEKVRDETSLLKKTLKRKEKQKKKSEKEWTERTEGVKKAGAMRQKKREENLRKRREEKGGKGKKGKGGKSAGGAGKKKVKSRPGFEGSFGGGKKK